MTTKWKVQTIDGPTESNPAAVGGIFIKLENDDHGGYGWCGCSKFTPKYPVGIAEDVITLKMWNFFKLQAQLIVDNLNKHPELTDSIQGQLNAVPKKV